MSTNAVQPITSLTELDGKESLIVIFFSADWNEQSKAVAPAIDELAKEYQSRAPGRVKFASVEVDGDSASAFGSLVTVKLVPTVAIIERDGSGRDKVAAVIEGANVPAIVTKVEEAYKRINSATSSIATTSTATSTPTVTSTNTGPATEDPEKLDARLNALVKKEPVMLFMKGNPEQPRCGFSRQIVELLNQQRISFGSFDILSDNAVREGLKKKFNWPTYPQLYVNGSLLGGLDVIRGMAEEDDLRSAIPAESLRD